MLDSSLNVQGSVPVAPSPVSIPQETVVAANTIQSFLRMRFACRKLEAEEEKQYSLSEHLLEQAKVYIEDRSKLSGLPIASRGKTPVYLPKELPIVPKLTGSQHSQIRLAQMREGRKLCDKNRYKHLDIPAASVRGDFIIERRLPLLAQHTKEHIGLYIENSERFSPAIREFVGFLCQADLSDITGARSDPYNMLSEAPIGRYDNVALYLNNEQGYIGLIDLETFQVGVRAQPGRPRLPHFLLLAIAFFQNHLFFS